MKKYQILTIPDWLGGTFRNGVELGPAELEKFIVSGKLKNNFVDGELNISIPEPAQEHLHGKYKKVKYLPEIKIMCNTIQKKINSIKQKTLFVKLLKHI